MVLFESQKTYEVVILKLKKLGTMIFLLCYEWIASTSLGLNKGEEVLEGEILKRRKFSFEIESLLLHVLLFLRLG